MNKRIVENILRLLEVANQKDWKPWELQTELRKLEENVIAVGDDLSFTIRLDGEVYVDEKALLDCGARRTRIHPFKKAYRFQKGFIAVEGRFIRVSRDFEPEELMRILLCLR